MIDWILKNIKLSMLVFTTIICPTIAGTYAFITIVLNSPEVNAQQDKKIKNIEASLVSYKKEQDINNAILSGIKEDTQIIKEILYKKAVRE